MYLFISIIILLFAFFLYFNSNIIETFKTRHRRPYHRHFRNITNTHKYWNNTYSVWPFYLYNPFYCSCKKGCTKVGCVNPGKGIHDCVWASDCNCC